MANVYQQAEPLKHLEIEQPKSLQLVHSSKLSFQEWRSDYQRNRFARHDLFIVDAGSERSAAFGEDSQRVAVAHRRPPVLCRQRPDSNSSLVTRNTFDSSQVAVRPGKSALYGLRGVSGTHTGGAHQKP